MRIDIGRTIASVGVATVAGIAAYRGNFPAAGLLLGIGLAAVWGSK